MMRFIGVALLLAGAVAGMAGTGNVRTLPPDERMDCDILLIVAHPDDETAVGAYLAKAIFDEGKSVAIVYCNHGTGGGNTHGYEQASSMGLIREIEARRATASMGIDRVWFLSGRDTPGQDVLRSLQEWHHGTVLEELVRVVRLTRPEIILTWLPHFVAGENHGDHQAAGVVATEAFDVAGDPTVFPAQVTPARERLDINNATEGLQPWQPQKLYYFSDASHIVTGDGPPFDIRTVSPSKHMSYLEMSLRLGAPHRTQGEVSDDSREALRTGDSSLIPGYHTRFRLLFGKAIVPSRPDGPVFEGVSALPAAFMPAPGYRPPKEPLPAIALGGPFAFYRAFWQAHGIERIGPLVPPEIEVSAGSFLHVPLLLHHQGKDTVAMSVRGVLPAGWKVAAGEEMYDVPPGVTVPVQVFVQCPAAPGPAPVLLRWDAMCAGQLQGTVTIMVTLSEWTLPQ